MKCKLCHEEKKLVNSHIIPEFFYKELYDSKHRYLYIQADPEKNIKLPQKGQREELLCVDCENKFSKLELYSKKLFFGGKMNRIPKEFHKEYLLFRNLDYKTLKLFQLSILWRSSVSSLDFFSQINLGPHQEVIRLMLLNNNPGQYYDYGCVMSSITIDNALLDVIRKPDKVRFESMTCYRFLISGFIWFYIVSSNSINFQKKNLFLTTNGELFILKSKLSDFDFILKEMQLFKLRKNDEKYLKDLARNQ